MKIEILPGSIGRDGFADKRQHLIGIIINDILAIDAGPLAFACSNSQRRSIRDVVISHTHIDHIAGLPSFIDDLFPELTSPVRVYGTREMISALTEHIFNGVIYPRFQEFVNSHGSVLEFREYSFDTSFNIESLEIKPFPVDHAAQSAGFAITEGIKKVIITGDTSESVNLVNKLNEENADMIITECAFPNRLADLAKLSGHMTPSSIGRIANGISSPIMVSNIKAAHQKEIVNELRSLKIDKLSIAEPGKIYEF